MSRSARRKRESPTAEGFVYCGEIDTATESGVRIRMAYWLPPDVVARHGKGVPPAPKDQQGEAA